MKRLGPPPYVCLITEGKTTPNNYRSEKPELLETIREAIIDGVNLVQIREKALTALQLFDLSLNAVSITAPQNAILMVNGRADIALAAGADGVHLPEDSLAPEVVRKTFGRDLLIGVSAHSIDGAVRASVTADYISFAPVFETPGKGAAAGIDVLRVVCDQTGHVPVLALGGVDAVNCMRAVDAGAAGIAGIRSLNDRETRRQVINALRQMR